MKKIFLTLTVFVMAICANAQTNQYFWYQGNLMMGNPIAQIDSVTFGIEDTDSILIYLPRAIAKTIEIRDTTYITIHDTVRIKESSGLSEGALVGEFSVGATKKVHFSKGNLQYQASTGTWRFAEHQYDAIGDGNNNISDTYSGWIDLFGWGTASNPTLTSTDDSDYSIFTDWGINAISNGGKEPNVWRTLTRYELEYLFVTRQNASMLFSLGNINGVSGTILLPDNWTLPSNVSFIPNSTADFTHNSYTIDEWRIMESAGAVFLPAAGGINRSSGNSNVINVGSWCNYHSSTPYFDGRILMVFLCFSPGYINPTDGGWRYDCRSVRLIQEVDSTIKSSTIENTTVVHDTVEVIVHDTLYITIHDTICPSDISEGALNGVFSVAGNKKVHFAKGNLQYQASTDTWRFAENQHEYIGTNNRNISPTYSDWIDLFGWGTGNNPTLSSNTNSDYSTFTDWGLNAISNGGNEINMWRTLTKNEWYYVLYTRSQATSLWGFGTINGVNGMILLPDNYELPTGISFTPIANKVSIDEFGCFNSFDNPDEDSYYLHNTFTLEQWNILESWGAVFLPAAGMRNPGWHSVDYVGTCGNYWSASLHVEDCCSIAVTFRPNWFHPQNWNDCSLSFGFSVRLVQDVDE